jgi:glycosyltransferase involved in cell wall biosynthesis
MQARIPVAIFVDQFIAGGTQRQMIELLERLDRRQFRVHPVCFHTTGEWFGRVARFDEPVAVFPIHGFYRAATARQLIAFARWCRANDIAVLHTCELYSNIFGLPGGALASVPVRIGSRRGMLETPAQQRAQRLAYTTAHRVVANSEATAARLRLEGVPSQKIDVIYNGIDLAAFPVRRRTMSLKRIAMVACLREEKRIDVLIAAAPYVLARHPAAEFWIVGDGACREQLVALARQTGVFGRFRFLGHRDDVPALLSDADVFVLPSRSEAFPNSVIEAMAAGLPVVATTVGGIPELVSDGHNGRLVPTGDAPALARALVDLLDEPARAAELGQAARQRVEQMCSFDRMVSRFAALYLTELDARGYAAPREKVA